MQLSYKKFGEGPPVVILHGLYGSSDNWVSIGRVLSTKFSVYIPDLRNHGNSGHSNIHNYPSLVEDVLEFLSQHNISNTIIIGHSMGGKTAMLLALTHPHLINKLVVVDIAPKAYTSLDKLQPHIIQHLNIINAFASTSLVGKTIRKEVEEEFANYVKEYRTRQFLLKNLIRNNNGFAWAIHVDALKKALPEIMDGPDFTKLKYDKEAIQFPVLFIRGEKSEYILDGDIQTIKKYFPRAELVTVFDAGHWVHAEQPELFLKSINYFLE
jgi:pimeloyl-ACP methyl ester carboxylesterase